MKLTALALFTCLVLGGCRCKDEEPPPGPPPDRPTTHEGGGLRSSVTSVVRSPSLPGRMQVTYELEWTAMPTITVEADGTAHGSNLWLLKPYEPVYVRVRDGSARLLAETSQHISLPPPFLDRAVEKKHTMVLLADVPAGAATVSVALGMSGLETRPMAVPAP